MSGSHLHLYRTVTEVVEQQPEPGEKEALAFPRLLPTRFPPRTQGASSSGLPPRPSTRLLANEKRVLYSRNWRAAQTTRYLLIAFPRGAQLSALEPGEHRR